MKISIQIKLALTNIIASKLRAILAILGILVGCAAFVALVSMGKLASYQALKQFKSLDRNLLAISIAPKNYKNRLFRNRTKKTFDPFDIDTALDLKTSSSEIINVAPYIRLYAPLSFLGYKLNFNGSIIGATENLLKIMDLSLQEGRFVSYFDQNSFYCVIGKDVYEELDKYTNQPLKKQIKLGQDYFTIIGISQPKEENMFVSADSNKTIFIPIKAAKLIYPHAVINSLIVELKYDADIEKAKKEIQEYIEAHTVDKQVYFRSSKQIIDNIKKQREILTLFLGFIGGIALVVGGIGIMNIMLVSVTERKKEIGISLAIGARRGDIRKLFLIEAITLSLLGGIVGIITGVLIVYSIAKTKNWEFFLFLAPLFLGFAFAVLTGIFFGFYPAHKAAKLNPIEVLHSE